MGWEGEKAKILGGQKTRRLGGETCARSLTRWEGNGRKETGTGVRPGIGERAPQEKENEMEANLDKKFLAKVTPYDADGAEGVVRFALGNGQEVVARLADFPQDIRDRLAYHGLSQKVGDSVSGLSKERRFGDAYAVLQDSVAMLVAGNWNAGREGGSSDLVEALAKLKKLPVEDVRVAVKRMDEETLKRVMANPAVKAEIAKMKAKRAMDAAKGLQESVADLDIGI